MTNRRSLEWMNQLNDAYSEYTTKIPKAKGRAISLETAGWMLALLDLFQPDMLLDRGCGFSSYALRLWASGHLASQVFSVDDDIKWIETAKLFIENRGLVTKDDFFLWENFLARFGHIKFGFILEDASWLLRVKTSENLLHLVRPCCSMIIWDDANEKTHRTLIDHFLTQLRWNRYVISDRAVVTLRSNLSWLGLIEWT